jgi:hypothetical protein
MTCLSLNPPAKDHGTLRRKNSTIYFQGLQVLSLNQTGGGLILAGRHWLLLRYLDTRSVDSNNHSSAVSKAPLSGRLSPYFGMHMSHGSNGSSLLWDVSDLLR